MLSGSYVKGGCLFGSCQMVRHPAGLRQQALLETCMLRHVRGRCAFGFVNAASEESGLGLVIPIPGNIACPSLVIAEPKQLKVTPVEFECLLPHLIGRCFSGI